MSAVRFSAVASLRVAAYRLAVLSRLCFELIKTARFPIASRLAPRPVVPSFLSSARILIKLCSFRSSPSAPARPRFSPIVPPLSDAPPNRHARRGEKRRGDDYLTGPCYMNSCCVIYSAFLLYISCSCYISGVLVIYLAFLLYLPCSCYMPVILVISLTKSCVPSRSPLSCVAF